MICAATVVVILLSFQFYTVGFSVLQARKMADSLSSLQKVSPRVLYYAVLCFDSDCASWKRSGTVKLSIAMLYANILPCSVLLKISLHS